MDISRGAGIFATLAGPVTGGPKGTGAQTAAVDKFSRVPKGLMDQMVLEAAQNGAGQTIIRNLGDARFLGMDKCSYAVRSEAGLLSEVHYVRDPVTGNLFDFKFKHHAERYR